MRQAAKEKFIRLYDTAKKCLLIIDHLFAELDKGTRLASDSEKLKADESITIRLYISSLSLIDYFHRFHQVVDAMPLLNKKLPEVRKLRDLMKPVKDCRHYLQHMSGDLSKGDVTYSILGSISWVRDDRNFTLFSGQPTQTYNSHTIAYDSLLCKYICKYQIAVGGHEIHIDHIYQEVKSFWSWLNDYTEIRPVEIKLYEWGSPTIIQSWFSTEPAE